MTPNQEKIVRGDMMGHKFDAVIDISCTANGSNRRLRVLRQKFNLKLDTIP